MKRFKKIIPLFLVVPLLFDCAQNTNGSGSGGDPADTGGGDTDKDQITLESISLSGIYKTVYEIDEQLDITGLVVTGHYSDDSTKTLSITTSNVTGFDSSRETTSQTLTVTVEGKTATYQISVIDNTPSDEDLTIDEINPVLPSTHINAEKVYLDKSVCELYVDSVYFLSPVIIPDDAFENVKYIIEGTSVEKEGNFVVGKSAGSSLIKAYNDENDNDVLDSGEAFTTTSMVVYENTAEAKINIEQNITITVGERKNIEISGENITLQTNSMGYYTTDDEIADFGNKTLVGYKSGECDIYVTSNNYSAKSHVTVVDKNNGQGGKLASDVIAKNKLMRVAEGKQKNFEYSLYPLDASETPLFITSADPSIATIEDGKLQGKKVGTTLISIALEENGDPVETVRVDVYKENQKYEDSYYNNYYGDLTWENGEDLKQKLHAIISNGKNKLEFNGSTTNWETNQNADFDLYDFSYMASVYGRDNILKSSTNSGWQREHAFCASLMTNSTTGNAVKTLGRATDFHNLYAAYASGNTSRKNKCLGNAKKSAPDYTDRTTYEFTRKWFEPTSEVDKGKLARAIFYMAVMYNEVESSSFTESGSSIDVKMPKLNIVKDNIGYNRLAQTVFTEGDATNKAIVDYYSDLALLEDDSLSGKDLQIRAYELYLENALPYTIGGLSDLLDWNTNEVTQEEMHHNESVYSYNSSAGKGCQNNRNPFVDYPELVDYVFGDLRFKPGSLKNLRPTCVALEMQKDEIHHFALGDNAKREYKVGDTISATSLDLRSVKNNLSIAKASESDLVNPYTFTESDVGSGKEIVVNTTKNQIKLKVNVKSDSGQESGYIKETDFDASKTYFLSKNGELFAKASIASKVLNFTTTESEFAEVTFELVEGKTDEYNVKLTNGSDSIYLGNNGSSTDLNTNKSNWKVSYLTGGGYVLTEASSGRFLGMSSSDSTTAKAYAASNLKVDSKYPPVYLYILK